jgi:hypothetical protein
VPTSVILDAKINGVPSTTYVFFDFKSISVLEIEREVGENGSGAGAEVCPS